MFYFFLYINIIFYRYTNRVASLWLPSLIPQQPVTPSPPHRLNSDLSKNLCLSWIPLQVFPQLRDRGKSLHFFGK